MGVRLPLPSAPLTLYPSFTHATPLPAPMLTQAEDDRSFLNACREGDLPTATRLATPRRVSLTNGFGTTGLHWACDWGRLEVAQMLVQRGAAVGVKINDGITPLSLAKGRGHTAVVEWLEVRLGSGVRHEGRAAAGGRAGGVGG